MEYVRILDRAAYDAVPVSERFTHEFLDRASGAQQSRVRLIRTPPGGGSPEGFHTHEFEQVFAFVNDFALGDLVEIAPGNHLRKRALT